MTIDQDIPTPPRRLFDDRRILNQRIPPDWEPRRANKMRERFYVRNHEPLPGSSLISPVHPSVPPSYRPEQTV